MNRRKCFASIVRSVHFFFFKFTYSEEGVGWMIRGSICIFIPKRPDRPWSSLSLLFNKVLIIKANETHYFSTLFGKELYLFRTHLLSIIRSLNTVFTAIGIWHTSYVAVCLTLLADGNITSTTNTYCCEYSINRLTPNDPCTGRTAPLTSKRCILYIYSTNIGAEYFKHAL